MSRRFFQLIVLLLPVMFSGAVSAQQFKPELVIQRGHSSAIFDVNYSPDGKLLLSGTQLGDARLWDVETGAMLRSFTGGLENCKAQFVLNGRLILLTDLASSS